MKYKHITLRERVEIYSLHKQGSSLRDIAKGIGRDVSSVSRELARNRTYQYKQYDPVKADDISQMSSTQFFKQTFQSFFSDIVLRSKLYRAHV